MTGACDTCLRRSWLVARLAGRIELARHERRRLREILALTDEGLLDGVAGDARPQVAAELEALEPDELRDASVAADLETVCRHGDGYPVRLLELADAPAALWVAGGRDRLAALAGDGLDDGPRAVAVVGTRRASVEGMEVARALGRGLSAAGVTVVSGMALGIDAAAHAGALEGEGRTVAVLAGGVDLPYPRRKAHLHGRISRVGCVVSEMPPGTTPFRWGFPARNRITTPDEHRGTAYPSHPRCPSPSRTSRPTAHSGTTPVPRQPRRTPMTDQHDEWLDLGEDQPTEFDPTRLHTAIGWALKHTRDPALVERYMRNGASFVARSPSPARQRARVSAKPSTDSGSRNPAARVTCSS